MAGYDPKQPRDDEGKWTDSDKVLSAMTGHWKGYIKIFQGVDMSSGEFDAALKKLLEEGRIEHKDARSSGSYSDIDLYRAVSNDDKVVEAAKVSSDYYKKTRSKWDPDAEQWEEYLEREYPDLDEFFKNGGTNRKALALMDKGEATWSPGAIKYFREKYKPEKVTTLSSEDARIDRILRTRDSTGKATSRRW